MLDQLSKSTFLRKSLAGPEFYLKDIHHPYIKVCEQEFCYSYQTGAWKTVEPAGKRFVVLFTYYVVSFGDYGANGVITGTYTHHLPFRPGNADKFNFPIFDGIDKQLRGDVSGGDGCFGFCYMEAR